MSGAASLHIATTDIRLSLIASMYSLILVDANVPGGGPPAFVTRMSMLVPSCDFASLIRFCDPSMVETSARIGIELGMVFAALVSRSSVLPDMTVLHPASASAAAVA